MGCITDCVNSRFCLRIRRNETIQRTTRRMDKAPNGIWSSFPVVWAIFAWMFSLVSSCVCTFVIRTVSFTAGGKSKARTEGADAELLRRQGIGFWGWESSDGTCFAYTIAGNAPSFDTPFQAASALTATSIFVGGVILVCLLLGTVFPVIPKHYAYLGYGSLFMSILSFSTLAIIGSNVCSPGFFQYAFETDGPLLTELTSSSCGIGAGSTYAILAGIFWILTALSCLRTPLANLSREPGAYRGVHHKETNTAGSSEFVKSMEGEPEDEAARIHRQRQAENEARYKRLMGEIDDEEAQPGFDSLQATHKRLSDVREEDDGDELGHPVSSSFGYPRRQSHHTQDDQFEDEHSEARSQYSDEEDVPLQASNRSISRSPAQERRSSLDKLSPQERRSSLDRLSPQERRSSLDRLTPQERLSPQDRQSSQDRHSPQDGMGQNQDRSDDYYHPSASERSSDDDDTYNDSDGNYRDHHSMAENSEIV